MAGRAHEVLAALRSALADQRELYARLLDEANRLGEEAARAPEEADVDRMLELVEAKQKSLQDISALEERVRPLREEWAEARPELSEEERAPLSTLVEELAGMMQAVMEAEEENTRRLSLHAEAIGRRLDEVRRARKAGQAYGEHSRGSHPRFYDERK